MRERAFYYHGNRRLDPSRLDPAGTLGRRLEDSRKEILMQRIRNSPLNLLDGIKIDYVTMIDRIPAVRSYKEKEDRSQIETGFFFHLLSRLLRLNLD